MNEKCKHCIARSGTYCSYLEKDILSGSEVHPPCEGVEHHAQT